MREEVFRKIFITILSQVTKVMDSLYVVGSISEYVLVSLNTVIDRLIHSRTYSFLSHSSLSKRNQTFTKALGNFVRRKTHPILVIMGLTFSWKGTDL